MIAYFDCFAGISGDMTLGALIDAGTSVDAMNAELSKLGLDDEFTLRIGKTVKHGIAATDVHVDLHHHHDHHHGRSYSDIKRIIEDCNLADTVKSRAVAIFTRLGEAEAKVHGVSIDDIHFHEVGAVDAIVDIVGTCICLDLLGITSIISGPIPTFHGTIHVAHGLLPLPAPATLELLRGVPWRECGIEGELVTPTGAAILTAMASSFGPMPGMSIECTGFGAGKKDFGIPNVLRIMIGKQNASSEPRHTPHREVDIIETNIDDLNPQMYDVVMERLFGSDALDVYLTPIQMKKNRPATLLTVICAPEQTENLCKIIFEETTSIGVRIDTQSRMCLHREIIEVQTEYGPIRIKISGCEGKTLNIQPEYDDCKAAARSHNVPVKKIHDTALAAWINRP